MKTDGFVPVERSLVDLLGRDYLARVAAARAALTGGSAAESIALAEERVAFHPAARREHLAALLDRVGTRVVDPLPATPAGAGPAAFRRATRCATAPLGADGYYRVGEDGRLYLTTKSEHYHVPLGHGFSGYALVERARELGIPNATHNNTRGFITRRLEEELVRTASGLAPDDRAGLDAVLAREDDLRVVNRVLNLETGSLAVEAALKLVLARFHRMEADLPEPPFAGLTPVILVVGNDEGGLPANYHGTTVLTQCLRGMWPGLHAGLESAGLWRVVAVRPNRTEDLDAAFAGYDRDRERIAGFFHEIVMMNYGGRVLSPDFLRHAYALCAEHDAVTVVDEIQSCLWAPGLYLYREYGLAPSCVAIGKGFPGGEYAASRLLFSAALDRMKQFGALVTNGQEELASLAYLVTVEWARANAAITAELGACYHDRVTTLAAAHPRTIVGVDGWNHMPAIRFVALDHARTFAARLGERGLDASVQTYKNDCPPVVLTKLPLVADRAVIDFVIERMAAALAET